MNGRERTADEHRQYRRASCGPNGVHDSLLTSSMGTSALVRPAR
jgi:hypothetical protein